MRIHQAVALVEDLQRLVDRRDVGMLVVAVYEKRNVARGENLKAGEIFEDLEFKFCRVEELASVILP